MIAKFKLWDFSTLLEDVMLNKNTQININYPENPTLEFAAKNLKKYLEEIFGGIVELNHGDKGYSFELNVDPSRTNLKYDGFCVTNTSAKTTIVSRVPRGVLYGVYDFLERYFDVRFYAPDCEIVPQKENVDLPLGSYISNPAFPLRGAYNGANRLSKDYYSKSRNHNQFEIVEEKYGGDCGWERVNNLTWATGHNTLCYVPKEIYAKDHPEMFAHNRGEITDICFTNGITDDGKKADTELSCVTVISDYIKRRIVEDENLRYFMIGQTDSWGGFENECNCDRCKAARKKYRSSGILVRFLNVVADEVKDFVSSNCPEREVYVMGFSYSQTFEAPAIRKAGNPVPIDDTVVCRDNVIMWLCQSGGMSWGINKQYSFADEKRNPVSAENYQAWLKVCKKIMIWEYCVNYSEFFWYFPSLKMTQESIRASAAVNCEYYLGLFGYADINEWQSLLKGYIASKQLWNPELDYQSLLKEFLDGYYGAGAPFVQKIIDLFENHFQVLSDSYKEFTIQGTKSDDVLMNGNYYPLELLDKAEELIRDGIKEIELKGIEVESLTSRMHCVLLTPMRMRLYNYYLYHKDKKGIFDYFEQFKEMAKSAGVQNISEGGKIDRIEWQMNVLKELYKNEAGAWDIYRYLYDGIVNNYQLPKRDSKD